jgi:alkanesulfonate monooxygenase SsuD/methylene tetrahydromethanopterin reductase-like flavin-dependent oxidoreductase (luciferase family)
MRVDTNFFGTVPMPDAGDPSIAPTDRRYGQADYLACYDNMIHWAKTAEATGFDTMWFTEHHFQYEGYEVLPNLVQFSLYCATQTEHMRFGQMFNVVPQWHPLRLAEDFALADVLSKGRMQFGVGRGTVPREAQSLGTVVASGDNAMSEEMDRINRERFEESIDIILAAWSNERFSYRGKHFVLPPDGIPDRGGYVTDLTMIPKPYQPKVDVYQAVMSGPTAEYVPRMGFNAVYWLQHPESQKEKWDMYADFRKRFGNPVAPGKDRVLVLNAHVARTREEAIRRAKPGHDEFCKFLAPYGRFSSYRTADGGKVPFGFQPTIEDSIEQQIWAIGSVDDLVDTIGMYRELLDLDHLCFFFDLPGLTRAEIDEQFHLVASEVFPKLGEPMERRWTPAI